MINCIPIIGWLLSLFFSVSLSVPFWFCWTKCNLGARYFYWLPGVYHQIPFWHCVGLFMVLSILKWALVPRLADVKQETKASQ